MTHAEPAAAVTPEPEDAAQAELAAPEQAAPADTAPAGLERPEPESAVPESAVPESAVPESAEPEDAAPQNAALESAALESAEPESAEPGDAALAETAPAGLERPEPEDAAPAEQAAPVVPERVVADGAAPDEARPTGLEHTAAPSWAKVVGTTLRLWLQRRTGRLRPRWQMLARSRWRLAGVLVGVAAVFAAGALTVGVSGQLGSPEPGSGNQAQTSGGGSTGAAAAIAAAAMARQSAAAWITAQVGHSAIVACDPVACSTIEAQGFPATSLLVLTPATPDPLGSNVVVSTAAVRAQFGSRLAGVYAPVVLASFGSAAARVDIRVIAPDGTAAYLSQLRTDLTARKTTGALLLHNSQVSASGAAQRQLAAGQADTRLLITLAALAHSGPLRIDGLADAGPGADPGVPLRSAELASPHPGSDGGRGYLTSLMEFLGAQRAPLLAASMSVQRLNTGQFVLWIEFAAPSPLGMLGVGAPSPVTNGR